jgi:hypothetical protein
MKTDLSLFSRSPIALFPLVLLLAGCGNSSDDAASSTARWGGTIDPRATLIDCTPFAGHTVEETCDRFARAACANRLNCSAMKLGINADGCVEQQQAFCQGLLGLPGTGYTTGYMAALAALYEQGGCEVSQRFNDVSFSCDPVHGTLASGSSCVDSSQCVHGACLVTKPGSPCGQCADITGTACTDYCALDQIHFDCINNTCQPRVASGKSCKNSYDCGDGLVCRDGACATPLKIGDNCTLNAADFDPAEGDGGCSHDAICDGKCTSDGAGMHTCTPGKCVQRSGVGGPCTRGQVVSGCLDWLSCLSNSVCGVPSTTAGTPCGDSHDCDLYGVGLTCAAGVCTGSKVSQKGEPCADSPGHVVFCATGLTCSADDMCIPIVEKGGACTRSDDCRLGLSCIDHTCQSLFSLTCH